MKIDEPDTPWASPPRELFEDPITEREGAAEDVAVAMDDVADRLRDMDDVGRGAAARRDGSSGDDGRGRPSSDEETNPGGGGGSERADDDRDDAIALFGAEGEAEEAGDAVLKARLFEAQRKSHQCTFRGSWPGGAMLEEEEEEEGEDAQGGMGRKPEEPFLKNPGGWEGTNEGGAGRSGASWEEKTHP